MRPAGRSPPGPAAGGWAPRRRRDRRAGCGRTGWTCAGSCGKATAAGPAVAIGLRAARQPIGPGRRQPSRRDRPAATHDPTESPPMIRTPRAVLAALLTVGLAGAVLSPATAAAPVVLDLGSLPRGAPPAVPYLEGGNAHVLVDGTLRIPVPDNVIGLRRRGRARLPRLGLRQRAATGRRRSSGSLRTGRRELVLKARALYDAQASPNGSAIATSAIGTTRQTTLKVYDVGTGAVTRKRTMPGYGTVLDFDGNRVAVGREQPEQDRHLVARDRHRHQGVRRDRLQRRPGEQPPRPLHQGPLRGRLHRGVDRSPTRRPSCGPPAASGSRPGPPTAPGSRRSTRSPTGSVPAGPGSARPAVGCSRRTTRRTSSGGSASRTPPTC